MLVPKQIVDVNGVHKIVHVRPDQSISDRTAVLSAPKPASGLASIPANIPYRADGKLPHVTIDFNGSRWDIAPPGYSGAYCLSCQHYYKDDEIPSGGEVGTCSSCGESFVSGRLDSGIRYDDIMFLDDDVVRESDWFHITLYQNWGENIHAKEPNEKPLVHIGSMESAEARMADLAIEIGDSNLQFYCHRVRLKKGANIAPTLFQDANDSWPESPAHAQRMIDYDGDFLDFTRTDKYELFGVTRYVNEVEHRGAISLIAHPDSFDVVEGWEV